MKKLQKKRTTYRFNTKQIKRVVTFHALADCIEFYATELKEDRLIELSKSIRIEANRYGEEFSDLADLMLDKLEALNYNHKQLTIAMCHVLFYEAKKIRQGFISENALSEFTQFPIAIEILDYFRGHFVNKQLIKQVQSIVNEIKENNFQA